MKRDWKHTRYRAALVLGVLAVFVVTYFVLSAVVRYAEDSMKEGIARMERRVGEEAPDFSLRTFDDDVLTLSEHRGKPVLLYFWAY